MKFTTKQNHEFSGVTLNQIYKDGVPQLCTRMPVMMAQAKLSTSVMPKYLPCMMECPLLHKVDKNIDGVNVSHIGFGCSPNPVAFKLEK